MPPEPDGGRQAVSRTLTGQQRVLLWLGGVGVAVTAALIAVLFSLGMMNDALRPHEESHETVASPSGAWVYHVYGYDLGGSPFVSFYRVEVAPAGSGDEARVVYEGGDRPHPVWGDDTTLIIGESEFDVRDPNALAPGGSRPPSLAVSILLSLLPALVVAAAGGFLVWYARDRMLNPQPRKGLASR